MENEKVFNLLETMYADLKGEITGLKGEITGLKEGQEEIKLRLGKVENTVTKIENEHGKKIDALLDGYKQNTEQLTRIEQEVAKHEEFILKRVK